MLDLGKSVFRWALALLLSFALMSPALSQPLSQGIQTSDGFGYFAEGGVVHSLSPKRRLKKLLPELEEAKLMRPSQGWDNSFLVQSKSGLSRANSQSGALSTQLISKGDFTLTPWGERVVATEKDGKSLRVLTPEDAVVLCADGEGPVDSVLFDGEQLLYRKNGLFYAVDASNSPRELSLPFSAKGADSAEAGGRVFVTHPEAQVLYRPATDESYDLGHLAAYGVRGLPAGEVLAGGDGHISLLDNNGFLRKYSEPAEITRASFLKAPAFVHGRALHFISDARGYYDLITYHVDRRIAAQSLEPGIELETFLAPSNGERGLPLLFFNTEFDEKKVDDDGREILDLDTGKPVIMKVKGHQLYSFQGQGIWEKVHLEPRSRLIGPVERIGETAVYATQTLPPNQPGVERDINHRYPYPQVILRGTSTIDTTGEWSLKVPRGQSPSKPRLPEKSWPMLGAEGPLTLTSEAGRLLSIDPQSGEVQWSSKKLPVDEASPPMYLWPEQLGLVAASGTTKKLVLLDAKDGSILAKPSLTATLDLEKAGHFAGVAVLCLALAFYIYAAGKRELYIRKIAGLQALDEAVGRATEMGKPVLYVTGLADVDDIQTLAALSILSHVARKTAEYDTPIVATTSRAVTYSAAQEVVRDAFTIAGRPDAFNVESVRYISDDQFGYTAGVDGIMLREKPAANFYMGKFYAESLILAETGHATGAIQIAGTAQPSQLPFFVAACDYTLIGEELFAASAYLSKDPLQVGSLRGQDVGKAIVMVCLLLGSLYVTFFGGGA